MGQSPGSLCWLAVTLSRCSPFLTERPPGISGSLSRLALTARRSSESAASPKKSLRQRTTSRVAMAHYKAHPEVRYVWWATRLAPDDAEKRASNGSRGNCRTLVSILG